MSPTFPSGRIPSSPYPTSIRYFLGSSDTITSTPRSVPLAPTFHLSSSAVANSSIVGAALSRFVLGSLHFDRHHRDLRVRLPVNLRA